MGGQDIAAHTQRERHTQLDGRRELLPQCYIINIRIYKSRVIIFTPENRIKTNNLILDTSSCKRGWKGKYISRQMKLRCKELFHIQMNCYFVMIHDKMLWMIQRCVVSKCQRNYRFLSISFGPFNANTNDEFWSDTEWPECDWDGKHFDWLYSPVNRYQSFWSNLMNDLNKTIPCILFQTLSPSVAEWSNTLSTVRMTQWSHSTRRFHFKMCLKSLFW